MKSEGPQLIFECKENKNFKTAYNYVLKNFSSLFDQKLDRVTLKSPEQCRGFLGLYRDRPDGATIEIRNGRYTVAEFMETLVHELVHLHQYTTGRAANMTHEEKEYEANSASYEVYKHYQRSLGNVTLTGVI